MAKWKHKRVDIGGESQRMMTKRAENKTERQQSDDKVIELTLYCQADSEPCGSGCSTSRSNQFEFGVTRHGHIFEA